MAAQKSKEVQRRMPPRGDQRPTLRTISELTGLAVPTVSRALNDAPDIGARTKERVREVARRVGYVPNRAGVRLRTGKTNVISLVLSTNHDVTDHTGKLISSIARTLLDTPYHMIVTPFFPEEDRMRPVRYIVETNSADGLILNQIEPEDSRVSWLMERGFPFATYGRSNWCAEHPYFDFDNASFGQIAANSLIRRGRSNLLLVAPPLEQSYATHMIEGINSVLAQTGACLEVLKGATSDDPGTLIRTRVAERLCRAEPVDGIICASTTAAISAVAGLERTGLTIGVEVDVFAKEAVELLGFVREAILTVREDVEVAGKFLAKAAIEAIEHPESRPMQALEFALPDGLNEQ